MKNFSRFKELSEQLVKKSIAPSIIDLCLAYLDKPIFEYLKKRNLKINVYDGSHKVKQEDKLLACADLNTFEISIYVDKTKQDVLSYIKQLPEALFHEIGHISFSILIDKCKEDSSLKQDILNFCDYTDAEGGCTLFAHNYVKEKYGKKLREENKHLINNIDIKYHENYAEFFQVYHIFRIDDHLNKLANISPSEETKDVSSLLSKKAIKTKEIYEKLQLYSGAWV